MNMVQLKCENCGKPNELREDALRAIVACTSCGDLLYELDESSNKVRITRLFRDKYRELSTLWPSIQKELGALQKQAAAGSSDLSLISIHDKQKEAIEIINILRNQNAISDQNTRASCDEFLPMLEHYLKDLQSLDERIQSEPQASEILSDIKSRAKDSSVFFHLMDMYLGERQPPGTV